MSVTPKARAVRWNKVALVGVGLLGGSMGLALKKKGLAAEVAGFVRRSKSIGECLQTRAVDIATLDLEEAVRNAELVVLCTPVARMLPLARKMLPLLRPHAVVTDVGSVKAGPVEELEPLFARSQAFYVGSHPMAGAETMGVLFARPDLFEGATCVLTPTRRSSRAAVTTVERLWTSLGCRVLRLAPTTHDQLVGFSSHLPQLVAATLATAVLRGAPKQRRQLCATGFRDTTRIASGSPDMWCDIALSNRPNIRAALAQFKAELDRFAAALKTGRREELLRLLRQAKGLRDSWRQERESS